VSTKFEDNILCIFLNKTLFIVPVVAKYNVICNFESIYSLHTLLYLCQIFFLEMIKSIAAEAILLSEMCLLFLMNFHSELCVEDSEPRGNL